MKKIAINGFGRIGRAALKIIMDTPGLELVGINDLMDIENAVFLLKRDSIYGKYEKEIKYKEDSIFVEGNSIKYTSIKDPSALPWKNLGVEVVIESTGLFTNKTDAEKHLVAGAKFVVISGPTKDTPTIVHGVNTEEGKVAIFSCASCTTNNIGPIIEILGRRIGIKKAILNTTHAYTASQTLVDAPSKKEPRMGRAAGVNSAPAATGAAIAVTKALPQFVGKFDGIAVRVPVPIGSISDITFVTEKPTTVAEINAILTEEAKTTRYNKVVEVTDEPLVSTDIIKSPFAATVDLEMTRVVDGDLVKVMAWYDNEWGFTNQMIRQIQEL
ncbi:type I glyceraldehyde-3-phosphate dehydrogenase [Flavobacterium aquatile]|uniref:Glyceraldehyde-3-phosphate dehydrogenase n=1 Tax=Flavobacterium aquatile LMG 4008 = ATCC 11947 TaxID=1453498 RepID=A0A095SYC9_9FLAO|nr:glyceraldehyde 3-phosphate dehydrogenase NAD-binding domain-containing protein [Flavobacterium aquatile]KGD69706.1 glyceraldehyde-3-phosphate dehydrogenase [Flavobacterium aquatile LMG 4008 = ATCC 11947]OXA67160.1 aldehyde dehydrogenase [Flavobacterium aquatile] [Flavobacterium aquatile LMG 4008 = ATCC 11947]GEC77813.1 glyceraldehyde-3-phosphate dehydrogenase [Flavobacterium aquatile]